MGATLYTFGLKRGVGVETISEFFSHLRLQTQLGSSPGALRGMMQALEQTMLETGHAWEQDGTAGGEGQESMGAVDETFFERLLLVFLALPTGDMRLEEPAEERREATWKARVETRRATLRAPGRSLVSARAKARIQRAAQGLEGLSIPDVLPLGHDLVQR